MHPNVNFGIKILRNTGKKLAKTFDEATIYSGNHHMEIVNSLKNIVTHLNQSIEVQLSESFSHEKVFFTDQLDSQELPENYWLFDAICCRDNLEHQIPFICMSLTYFEKSMASHAIVYNPLTDEVFSASKGMGAQYNQRRMRHNPTDQIKLIFNESQNLALPGYTQRQLGSFILSTLYTATNRGDLAIVETSLFNSDKMSAAKLICKEAALNFFKKDNNTTWVCSSKHLDRNTCEIKKPSSVK